MKLKLSICLVLWSYMVQATDSDNKMPEAEKQLLESLSPFFIELKDYERAQLARTTLIHAKTLHPDTETALVRQLNLRVVDESIPNIIEERLKYGHKLSPQAQKALWQTEKQWVSNLTSVSNPTHRSLAMSALLRAEALHPDTELALVNKIGWIDSRHAVTVIEGRLKAGKKLSLQAEIKLVELAGSLQSQHTGEKYLARNIIDQFPVSLNAQNALLEKLLDPDHKPQAFWALRAVKLYPSVIEDLVRRVQSLVQLYFDRETMSGKPQTTIPFSIKQLLLRSDLSLSISTQEHLVSLLSHRDSKTREIAKEILRHIGRQKHLAPTIQEHLVTKFLFHPNKKDKRFIGMFILEWVDLSPAVYETMKEAFSNAHRGIRQTKGLEKFVKKLLDKNTSRYCSKAFS